MPKPDLETWMKRWDSPEARRLGVVPDSVQPGEACFLVRRPYGDERDGDRLFTSAALFYAIDIAALAAVVARLDAERQQPNGTASLTMNFVAEPEGTVRARGTVAHWDTFGALVEVEVRDEADRLVGRGQSAYSLRPRAGGTS